ncbi:uridine kinase [Saccharomonospora sp. NPDC006951]
MTAEGVAKAVLAAKPALGDVRVLAVDGPSGSGKSTFASAVVACLREGGTSTALVSTDDFATWDAPVSWWPRLAEGVLTPLAAGRQGSYRVMDWTSGVPRLGESVVVDVPEVLVLEGVSAGRASIRPSLSLLCWVESADAATRLERAVARDGKSSRPMLAAWQRFEHGWFEVDQTRQSAHTTFGVMLTD